MLHSGTAVACLLSLLAAGCATGPRRTGVRVPDWESQPVIPAPAAPASAPAPTPEPPRIPPPTNEARRIVPGTGAWVSLLRWCKANGWSPPSRLGAGPLPACELTTASGAFVLRAGTQLAHWNGMGVWLGFAPQVIDGQWFVHALDLRKTLEPLLCPAPPGARANPPTIVIDPGHGGEDAGTRSVVANGCEKEFTLDWARRLARLLAAHGWHALLTRDRDMSLSLPERVAFAEARKADLFLSLHFNSSAPDHEQAGAETYCLTPAGLPSAVTRGFSDNPAQTFPNNAFDAQNLQLACRVQRALLQVNGNRDRGVRRARYLGVLRGQNRAAILVEGGYLSNPREARLIAEPAYRQQLAEAVARALLGNSDAASPKPAVAGPPPALSQTNSRP